MPRAALAILNELSLSDPANPPSETEVEAMVETFATALRAARRVRRDVALVSHQSLLTVSINETGLTLAAFLQQRGGRCRELLRLIRAVTNHAPFARAPSLRLPDDGEEFSYDGRHADGLGYAAANRKLAMSMQPAQWKGATMRIQRSWLDDTAKLHTEDVDVVHAATADDIDVNEQFLRGMNLPDPLTGAALWCERAHLFPCTEFLPRVEGQLQRQAAGSEAPASILEQLTKLDRAAAAWDPAKGAAFPDWGIRVTPEGDHRKNLCMFVDLDGQKRCFDLHTRFNPKPGRIHFRLVRNGYPRLVVAHIDRKLGT
jgi:hypothetical protein